MARDLPRKLWIERLPPTALKPDPLNPRRHSTRQIELIVAGSHRRRGISLPALGLPHEQGFAFSALQPLVVLVPSQPPGVCLVLTTGRWRQLSPGNSLRSAAPCRRMPREVRCYRFRLRLTLGLHCNPAS